MARSATLNPASLPFFPGGKRSNDDDANPTIMRAHAASPFLSGPELDRRSLSSFSVSPSEYRSVMSSPSPPLDERDPSRVATTNGGDTTLKSSPVQSNDLKKPQATSESRILREGSVLHTLEPLPEATDRQEKPVFNPPFFTPPQVERDTHSANTPPVPIKQASHSYHSGTYHSASPVSSLDSGSQYNGNDIFTPHFETQLKASPMIHEIMDRLVRYENSALQIQRDLGDVQRKVNLLVEHTMGITAQAQQPEFKDPFAPTPNGASFSSRASVGNIAPNQSGPDDISTISQRLNTLTSSVGQLLALQTQHMQPAGPHPNHSHIAGTSQADITAPNVISNQAMLGHGHPSRPDIRMNARAPNGPMRTWSTGILDLPLRQNDSSLNRPDGPPRDKRRSVTGLLRRDSSGMLDGQGDQGSRDGGPSITKWEQLQLAPDLLRSLNKFGVGPPNKIQQRALPFLLRGSDIIAQAPPTQERIAAYVIPAIQIALSNLSRPSLRGPIVVMISTTVDQATQAQRMIRDLGSPIGVRSALGVGIVSAGGDVSQELRTLQQNMPHILCGTPQKVHALFTTSGGLIGSEVRFLVLDEVDQLIARNLHEFVFNIVKLLPTPRSRPLSGANSGSTTQGPNGPSSFNQSLELTNPNGSMFHNNGRRFSAVAPSPNPESNSTPNTVERQTALFSNTVPQDVLNLATAIQLREPVRVLVRRDGNVTQSESLQGARGLRQYYLYLAFTAGGRADPLPAAPGGGLGIIGSGRGAGSSAETAQAREWKLDALADLLDDVEVSHAVVHVGGMTSLDSVVYKLASRGFEAVPLHGDMAAPTKLAALNKYRNAGSAFARQHAAKVLVVYDVQIKDIPQVPLIINYDLPKAVEEYAHRVSPAIAPNNYSRAGVIVNFVTATGGDVEMLRSIECFYKIKCPEVPMSLRDIV